MAENKKVLSLLKKDVKQKAAKGHAKTKPKLLQKYKSKFHTAQPQDAQPPEQTEHFCAIDLDHMPKALLAYHKASTKKNSIRPDNVPSTIKASPPPEKPPETTQIPLPGSPPKIPEDDEKYCICEQPYSDGELMFKCEGFCINWYHPKCIGLQTNEIERQKNNKERWYCPTCCERAMGIANIQLPNRKR